MRFSERLRDCPHDHTTCCIYVAIDSPVSPLYAQRRVHPSKQFLTLVGSNRLGSTQTIAWLSSSDVPTAVSIPPTRLTPKRGKASGHALHLFRYVRVWRSGSLAIAIRIDTHQIYLTPCPDRQRYFFRSSVQVRSGPDSSQTVHPSITSRNTA